MSSAGTGVGGEGGVCDFGKRGTPRRIVREHAETSGTETQPRLEVSILVAHHCHANGKESAADVKHLVCVPVHL